MLIEYVDEKHVYPLQVARTPGRGVTLTIRRSLDQIENLCTWGCPVPFPQHTSARPRHCSRLRRHLEVSICFLSSTNNVSISCLWSGNGGLLKAPSFREGNRYFDNVHFLFPVSFSVCTLNHTGAVFVNRYSRYFVIIFTVA